ncbi:MAG: HAD-IC family P-type ATPase [Anaerolineae bacterium]|nr:HAD-IC family P-type ATPase [Anaerolineae bacterium]
MATKDTSFETLPIEQSVQILETSMAGLTTPEARRRLEQFGFNELTSGKKSKKLKLLLEQFINPLVLVLVLAAVISILADHASDAIVIGVIIIVNAMIGFIQESRAEDAIKALRSRAAAKALALRRPDASSPPQEISLAARELVPGDVIILHTGDKIPADARLIEAVNLMVDEAMLTGESLPAQKHTDAVAAGSSLGDWRGVVFGGTTVTKGRGKAVVYATAMDTQIGKITTLMESSEEKETPLQRQTHLLGRNLALMALALSITTFTVGYLTGYPLNEMFLFALAAAVSAIPEGLPAVMTITLAVGVNRMAKRNAIIRKLRAVDTLGAATVIVSDKTGTLTTNQMTVTHLFVEDEMIEIEGSGYSLQGEFLHEGHVIDPMSLAALEKTLLIGVLCNDTRIDRSRRKAVEVIGDPTEGALLTAAAKAGMERDTLEQQYPRVDEIPFDSATKYMVTFHQQADGMVLAAMKGAPEVVLGYCARELLASVVAMPAARRDEVRDVTIHMAKMALRGLAMAYQLIPADDLPACKQRIEAGEAAFIFAGLAGMIDPPRPEVREAVDLCKQAGIRVMMATGDHQLTAEVIARDLGIMEDDDQVLSGAELEHLSDAELVTALPRTAVFARVSPEHKYRLVEALQSKSHVVTMTGDGVNDAPALKAAQVGVAMGITGTDVAREAAEMVLTDDNFASIVSAVEEGRVVFQNVRKVVKFLLATNIGEQLTILASLLLFPGVGLILTPVQILWINLVTDGILDITIAMEPREGDVMEQDPRPLNSKIINREMWINTLIVAVNMAIGTLFVFHRANGSGGIHHARTMVFTTLAMFQVFNAFNVRSRTKSLFRMNFFGNPYLLGAVIVSVVLQILSSQLPLMNAILDTVPLTFNDYLLIVPVSATILLVSEAVKFTWARIRAAKAKS